MSLFDSAPAPQTARALGFLRIVVGLLFTLHGTQKVLGFPAGEGGPTPFDLFSRMGVAGVLELVGGGLLVLGLLTRPVAFVLCGEMAVAYFLVHAPQSVFPSLNGGEPAALFCFAFLYFTFAGAGAFSLDARLAARRVVPLTRRRAPIGGLAHGT